MTTFVEKYRPVYISDIVHQDAVSKTLIRAATCGILPHLILHGPPGTGNSGNSHASLGSVCRLMSFFFLGALSLVISVSRLFCFLSSCCCVSSVGCRFCSVLLLLRHFGQSVGCSVSCLPVVVFWSCLFIMYCRVVSRHSHMFTCTRNPTNTSYLGGEIRNEETTHKT